MPHTGGHMLLGGIPESPPPLHCSRLITQRADEWGPVCFCRGPVASSRRSAAASRKSLTPSCLQPEGHSRSLILVLGAAEASQSRPAAPMTSRPFQSPRSSLSCDQPQRLFDPRTSGAASNDGTGLTVKRFRARKRLLVRHSATPGY